MFGIGSFTYQYNTRDTFGWAVKATYGSVNHQPLEIYKAPKTDSGAKKSAKGLIAVYYDDQVGKYYQEDQVGWSDVLNCEYSFAFYEGRQINPPILKRIREIVRA